MQWSRSLVLGAQYNDSMAPAVLSGAIDVSSTCGNLTGTMACTGINAGSMITVCTGSTSTGDLLCASYGVAPAPSDLALCFSTGSSATYEPGTYYADAVEGCWCSATPNAMNGGCISECVVPTVRTTKLPQLAPWYPTPGLQLFLHLGIQVRIDELCCALVFAGGANGLLLEYERPNEL
jgi:hypothetical protein